MEVSIAQPIYLYHYFTRYNWAALVPNRAVLSDDKNAKIQLLPLLGIFYYCILFFFYRRYTNHAGRCMFLCFFQYIIPFQSPKKLNTLLKLYRKLRMNCLAKLAHST